MVKNKKSFHDKTKLIMFVFETNSNRLPGNSEFNFFRVLIDKLHRILRKTNQRLCEFVLHKSELLNKNFHAGFFQRKSLLLAREFFFYSSTAFSSTKSQNPVGQ